MTARISGLVALSSSVALAWGCGSSGGDDLFENNGGKVGAAGSSGGSGGVGGAIGAGGAGASSGTGGSFGTGGRFGSGGGVGTGGGLGTDGGLGSGGTGGPATGGTGGDAASGGTGAGGNNSVTCGPNSCPVDSAFCCARLPQLGGSNCTTQGSNCTGSYVYCDDPGDCSDGQVCCGQTGTIGGLPYYQEVRCQPSCEGSGRAIFCAGDSSQCKNGTICQASGILPQYTVCRI